MNALGSDARGFVLVTLVNPKLLSSEKSHDYTIHRNWCLIYEILACYSPFLLPDTAIASYLSRLQQVG